MKKYLNGDPVPWLTDGENPAVTYFTEKEFGNGKDPDNLYSDLISSYLTTYFRKNSTGNILGNSKNFDLFYRGSVWFFLLAAESGYDCRTDFIKATADYLCAKTQLADGGFTFNWNPQISVGCRTGNLIKAMIRSGIKDERTSSGLSWIIRNQRDDGGWLHCPFRGVSDVMKLVLLKRPGNGHLDDQNISIPSCPVATFTCMAALAETSNCGYDSALLRAAEFFISGNIFTENIKFRTRCGLFTDPLNPGYPVMSQFDIISLLILLIKTPHWNNYRTGEMFNHIMKLQGNTGRWDFLNNNQGMIHEKKRESRWITLNALRMIKAVKDKENQLEKA